MWLNRRLFVGLLALCGAALAPDRTSAQQPVVGVPAKPRKVAILVGVSEFADQSLPHLKGFPERDVGGLAKVLEAGGFEVTQLKNKDATKKAVEEKVAGLATGARAVREGDVVLIALCTHGFIIENEGYVAATDTTAAKTTSMVSLKALLNAAARSKAATVVLVDACRGDPNRGGAKLPPPLEGLRLTPPDRTAVLFSCDRGQLAYQPQELGHGLFTYAVLKALRGETGLSGAVTWADLVSHVGKAFASAEVKKFIPTGLAQTPVDVKGEGGDITLLTLAPPKNPGDDPKRGAVKFGGKDYKFFPDVMTWSAAKKKCEEYGGRLAVVTSEEHNKFLTKLVTAAGKQEAWLGATDGKKEGTWVWLDNSVMWVEGKSRTYTNWDRTQPNNKPPGEHCLMLWAKQNGVWVDQPETALAPHKPGFFCEWP